MLSIWSKPKLLSSVKELTLLNDNFEDWSKLKALADDKNECDRKIEIRFEKGGKHYRKSRKCCLPAFSPFPIMFSNVSGWLKVGICVVKS